MALGRYLVEAHLREGRSVAELARTHGIKRSWLYKLLHRYREEGEAGLTPRSRRPHRSPMAMPKSHDHTDPPSSRAPPARRLRRRCGDDPRVPRSSRVVGSVGQLDLAGA